MQEHERALFRALDSVHFKVHQSELGTNSHGLRCGVDLAN